MLQRPVLQVCEDVLHDKRLFGVLDATDRQAIISGILNSIDPLSIRVQITTALNQIDPRRETTTFPDYLG